MVLERLTLSTLAQALVAAQKDMPKVEKDGRNPHFRSEFVTLDNLLDHVRPVLNKHGIAVVQLPAEIGGAPALTTTLIHGATGETIAATMPLVLAKNDMQGVGAAITYARRYMLAAALGIAEGEDDDGNQASTPSPKAATPSRAATPPTPEPEQGFQPPAQVISEAQLRRLWAIVREKGVPETWVKDQIQQIAGVDTSKEIPRDKYDQVIAAIQADSDIPF